MLASFSTSFLLTIRMMKFYGKMTKTLDALDFFLTHEFEFCTGNTKRLYSQLSPIDKKLFNFDIDSINWESFTHNYIAGIRKFLLHESDEKLEVDRVRYKR